MPAHHSRGSWPHKALHRRPWWQRPHAAAPPKSAHASRGSRPRRELHRTPQWQRPHAAAPPMSARPSRGSRPHRELHRESRRQRPHAAAPPVSAPSVSRRAAHEERAIVCATRSCRWLSFSTGIFISQVPYFFLCVLFSCGWVPVEGVLWQSLMGGVLWGSPGVH